MMLPQIEALEAARASWVLEGVSKPLVTPGDSGGGGAGCLLCHLSRWVFSLQSAMEWWWQFILGLWTVMPIWAGDELLNICMKAKPHKQEPSPEDQLYEEV